MNRKMVRKIILSMSSNMLLVTAFIVTDAARKTYTYASTGVQPLVVPRVKTTNLLC